MSMSRRKPPRLSTFTLLPRLALVFFVIWWLFGDTLRRYSAGRLNASQVGDLRLRHFGSYEDYELWTGVIADFERLDPPVRIRQEYAVGGQSQYHAKLLQEHISGAMPDVAIVQLGPFRELARLFEPIRLKASPAGSGLDSVNEPNGLPADLMADLVPDALRAFEVDGVQRALPICGGTLMVYGNPDCFARASRALGREVPLPASDWDMQVFRRLAEDLTLDEDGDGQPEQFGFWLPRWVYAMPLLWSFGAEVVDEQTGAWRLSGPAAEEALSFYRGLLVDNRVCPREDEMPLMVQDVAFLTGRVALCINGPWFEPFLRRTRLADRYFVAPIPTGPGGRWTRVTWDGVVIRAGLAGERRARAERFAAFLLSPVVQDRLAATGRAMPARVSCMKAYLDAPRGECRSAFADSLAWARREPATPHYLELDAALNRELQRFLDPADPRSSGEFLRDIRRIPLVTALLERGDAP